MFHVVVLCVFFFKQKTADEMRISDWSSDVCSSDLQRARNQKHPCALLGIKIANYDAIAAEYGREILDRTIVVAASHVRRAATDIDLAARVGEREFALQIGRASCRERVCQ